MRESETETVVTHCLDKAATGWTCRVCCQSNSAEHISVGPALYQTYGMRGEPPDMPANVRPPPFLGTFPHLLLFDMLRGSPAGIQNRLQGGTVASGEGTAAPVSIPPVCHVVVFPPASLQFLFLKRLHFIGIVF